MALVVILEIEKGLITPSIERTIRGMSKFYEIFDTKIITILYAHNMDNFDLYSMDFGADVYIELYRLNHFARNRLINNFEDDRPELTLCLMGCSEDSKLIKIWKKNVKR